jgi:hypothetical protein
VPDQVANARLILDGSIKLAQSEAPGSISSLKRIDAGVLNVGYVEADPIDGPAATTPRLASAGFRVMIPFARGIKPATIAGFDWRAAPPILSRPPEGRALLARLTLI